MNEQLKTPIEWVNELYAGKVRQRLLEYAKRYEIPETEEACYQEEHIFDLFRWEMSPEGEDFWIRVYESNNTLPQSWIDEVEGKTESSQTTFDLIRSWANDRNLLQKDNSFKQLTKMTEEIGEVAKEVLNNDIEKLKIELGDLVLSSTILAAQNNLSIEDCVQASYNKIKDRDGRVIDGFFIGK